MGASAMSSCKKCGTGTWSEPWGASSESTCQECKVGTFQPVVGQSSESVCIQCAPGNYSTLPGVASCAACPAGTWNDEFEATSCKLCQAGKWSSSAGSTLQSNCYRCSDASCLSEGSARISIEIRESQHQQRSVAQEAGLRARYAQDIAAAVGKDASSVVDLRGETSTVSIDAGGSISAFVLDLAGSSAHDLARNFYDAPFRNAIQTSTAAILGSSPAQFGIGAIAFTPEVFVPLQPTTTSTSTSTTEEVTTSSVETTIVQSSLNEGRAYDVRESAESHTTAFSSSDTARMSSAGFLSSSLVLISWLTQA